MVITVAMHWHALRLLAEQPQRSVLERLEPPQRAVVMMALLGLVITGLLLVACVMIGGRWVRRMARHKPASRETGMADPAQNQRLRESLRSVLPASKTEDTVQLSATPGETKVD